MRLLLFMMFFPFSFHGENNGRELLDMALEKCGSLESLADCRDILLRYGVADRIPLAAGFIP